MSTLHTTTKLNCAYIFWDIHRILTISQKVVDGVTPWITEIATAWPPVWTSSRVSTVQCVTNTLFQTLEQVFGRIKFCVYIYRSIFVLTGRFLHKHLLPPLEVASLSQQGRMATASWLPNYVHSNRKCTGQVIPFGNHFLQSKTSDTLYRVQLIRAMEITTGTLSFEPVRSTCAVQLYRVWVCQRSDCMTNTDETVAYGKIAFQYLQLMKFKASSDGGCILCVFPNSCNLIDTKTNKAVIISSLINLLWWSIGHHRPTRSAMGTTVPTAVLSTFCSMCLRGRLWVRSYLSPRLFVFVHLQTWGCAGVKG